jgi:hypothetical protein
MTIQLQENIVSLVEREELSSLTELSSRPERSAVERSAVFLNGKAARRPYFSPSLAGPDNTHKKAQDDVLGFLSQLLN